MRDTKVAEEVTDLIKPIAKVVVNISGIEADDNIKLTVEAEEILRFKCDLCNYGSISEKGLRQHMRMKHQISQVDGAGDTKDESREETIPLTASEVNENSSGNESETLDLDCFNMLGITEKCAISCNTNFSSKEECYRHMYLSHSHCCIKLKSSVEKNGFENNIRRIGFQKIMLQHTLFQIMKLFTQ